MPKHIHSLDYLRGIAALMVCVMHFTDKAGYLDDQNLVKRIFSGGHYGVEIFFIISGLVIPYSMYKGGYSYAKAGIFLKKRFLRIEPPYLICAALALMLNYLTTLSPTYVGKPFEVDYLQVIYHLGYLNVLMGKDWLNPVFWTLGIEFQFYLFIALTFPLFNSRKFYIWIPALICFNFLSLYFDRAYVFNFSTFFTAGILIFRYLTSKVSVALLIGIGLAMLSFVLFQYTYKELLIVCVTISVALMPLKASWFSKFFGEISFSLYLLHFPIGLRVINLTQRFIAEENWREAMILVALAISIGVSFLYYKFVEKPFKQLSHKISYKTDVERSEEKVVEASVK